MMKTLVAFVCVAAAALSGSCRDTNRYDAVVTDANGVTWSQRGGLGPSNYVATASNPGDMFQAIADGSAPEGVRGPFADAVAEVAPPFEQDFRATSLTHQGAFFDNLRTNKVESYSAAFSNAVVRFSPPAEEPDYGKVFDDARTGRVAGVTASFSNAVVRFSPPVDVPGVREEILGSPEFGAAVRGVAGSAIEGGDYLLSATNMTVMRSSRSATGNSFLCELGGESFPLAYDAGASGSVTWYSGPVPASVSAVDGVTAHLYCNGESWFAYFSEDYPSKYAVSWYPGTLLGTDVVEGTVPAATESVVASLAGAPVVFRRVAPKADPVRDLARSAAQDALDSLSDPAVSNAVRALAGDVPAPLMQGWFWDSTGTNGAFVTVYGNGTAVRELKRIWYSEESASSNVTVSYSWPKYIGYAPKYNPAGGSSVYNGGASNILWRKVSGSPTYAIASEEEMQPYFTRVNTTFVPALSTWVSSYGKYSPITVGSSGATLYAASAMYWKGSYYYKGGSLPLVSGVSVSDVVEAYWAGTGNLGGTGNIASGNVQGTYSQSYWYFLEDRSANDSGEVHHSKTVSVPYTVRVPHTNDLGTVVVNFLEESDPTVPAWAKAPDAPESGKIDAVKVNGVQLAVDATDPTNKFVDVSVPITSVKVNGTALSVSGHSVDVPVPDDEAIDSTVSEKVNLYKDLHWDPGLSVTWTNVYMNGHVYMVTVTNVNVSAAP